MNGQTRSSDAVTEALCPACGLCCDGTIFADVALKPGDDAERLVAHGIRPRAPRLTQPCVAFDGCRCRIYPGRPTYCRDFECALFKSVKEGDMQTDDALRVIRKARDRAHRVRQLLRALGDIDEHLPLSARFRRTNKRMQRRVLDEETAAHYAELTLAVHDLNLLLAGAFYPGSARPTGKRGTVRTVTALAGAALVLFIGTSAPKADQVELQNGDRYVGNVLSLNSNSVLLQSEVLGAVRLPRNKVAVITLGRIAGTNSLALRATTNASAAALSANSTNRAAAVHPALRQLGASTNLIRQVQKQFLSGAGAEANDKFNELLTGLMSGKLSVDDIRAQARTAADQLRALQKESGEEAGFAASAYLSILDHFLKETAPAGSVTNAPAPSATAKPKAASE